MAIATSAALLVALDSHVGFLSDDWEFLLGRPGWSPGDLLNPFNGNIVLAPALIYKLLLSVFGMGSALPFHLVSISLFLASALLLFAYLRRRVGSWLALAGVVPILFLGAAFEDLLWAFQMVFFGSMAAGLGMLLALDRRDQRGDQLACGLLFCSLAFSSLGIAFAAAALADVALSPRPRSRRAYLALLPIAAYALWWIGWGHLGGSQISVHNALHLPAFVFDAAAAGVTSLLGLAGAARSGPDQSPIFCQLLLMAGLIAGSVRVARQRRMSRGLAIALALALAFWILAGLDRMPGRYPTSSRYQYPSAIFILLIAAETLRGLRIRPFVVAAIVAVAGVAAISGAGYLHTQYKSWRAETDQTRSFLAAVEIAGTSANPAFEVPLRSSVTLPDKTYLRDVAQHGSPSFSEAELSARPEAERRSADSTLAAALGLTLDPTKHVDGPLPCKRLRASTGGSPGASLAPGTITLTNTGHTPVSILLARFADSPSVKLGALAPHADRSLRIPTDESPKRWSLGLGGAGSVRLCSSTPRSSRALRATRKSSAAREAAIVVSAR